MEERITKEIYTARESFYNTETFACGIKEDILLQLEERHKGIGVFGNNAYIFKTFDMSTMHNYGYDSLGSLLGGEYNYIVSVMKQGEHIDVNIFPHGKFISSEFEIKILESIKRECEEAQKLLPEDTIVNDDIDNFIIRQKQREEKYIKEMSEEIVGIRSITLIDKMKDKIKKLL